jgi:hypothetical protein
MGPVLLLLPVLLLADAVLTLGEHGPLGWSAGAGLVVASLQGSRLAGRRALRWWRSTKAPERPRSSSGLSWPR